MQPSTFNNQFEVIKDMPFKEYLEIEAVSSHRLNAMIKKSPLHARHYGKNSATKAMNFGTLVHAMLLTPDLPILIKPEVSLQSKNGVTVYRDWLSEVTNHISHAAGFNEMESLRLQVDDLLFEAERQKLTIVSKSDYLKAQNAVERVREESLGQAFFEEGDPEVTILAVEPHSKLYCKTRLDWLRLDHNVIVDVKTAQDAQAAAFSRAARRYGYDVQAAFYRLIFNVAHPELDAPSYFFVVIENEEPHDCAFYELDGDSLREGAEKVYRALDTWSLCENLKKWPGLNYDWHNQERKIETISTANRYR